MNNIMGLARKKWMEMILIIVLVVQALFIIYMNFFAFEKILNFDGVNLMLHAVEMWKNKTPFITGWVETTTLELDCATLIAAPVYGITKNIIVSFGIANMFYLLYFIFVVKQLFKYAGYEMKYFLLALSIILVPYTVGMVEYFNMLFFQGAQYSIKVLIPILLLTLLMTPDEQQKKPWTIINTVILFFLVLISGISSGVYVLFCGICPIIASVVLDIILDNHFKKYKVYHFILIGVSFVLGAVGYYINVHRSIHARGNTMYLTNFQDFHDNFAATVTSVFHVIGALPSANTAVFSVDGITYILKVVLVLAMILTVIITSKKVLVITEKISLKRMILVVFFWNLFVFIFCETRNSLDNKVIESRYYLIPMLLLMILFSMQVKEYIENSGKYLKNLLTIAMPLLIFVMTVGCSVMTVKQFDTASGYLKNICNFIQDSDAKSVFFIDHNDVQGTCRYLDPTRTYSAYNSETQSLVVYDYYQNYIDRANFGDENIIAVFNWLTPDQMLPVYIYSTYEKIGSVDGFDLYYSKVNHFDGRSGLPEGNADRSWDFFYTSGYEILNQSAVINNQGQLEITGDGSDVVKSPILQSQNSQDITVYYEAAASAEGINAGSLQLCNDEGIISEIPMPVGEKSVTLTDCDLLSGGYIKINAAAGVSLKLDHIEYVSISEK